MQYSLAWCGIRIDQLFLKTRGIFVAVWFTIWLSLLAGWFASIVYQDIQGILAYQVKPNFDRLLSITNQFDSCTDDITYVTADEIS